MIQEFMPEYCDQIPEDLEEGILYISKRFEIAIHLCACGCKGKTVTHFSNSGQGWILTESPEEKVTLRPSIGNWAGENPYHAHYFITENKVQFV